MFLLDTAQEPHCPRAEVHSQEHFHGDTCLTGRVTDYPLSDYFESAIENLGNEIAMTRQVIRDEDELSVLRDVGTAHDQCLFLRASSDRPISFSLKGDFRISSCPAGGWIAHDSETSRAYWFPASPKFRKIDAYRHVLAEQEAVWLHFDLDRHVMRVGFQTPPDGWVVDGVVWQLGSESFRNGLHQLSILETQGYFLLGSHTCYRKPGDLYRHLIHGHIYEDRYAWPHHRKVCSENDAHALSQILSGLEQATGKSLYRTLKAQVLRAVLDRQSPDGGFRHGEWTDHFESHYRLHCSAMHLFMDTLEDGDSPEVRKALQKAASFLAKTTDTLVCGKWFLHDELEQCTDAEPSREPPQKKAGAFGKSEKNLLVLNTHLDSSIALDRFGTIAGESEYRPLVDEANRATDTVLAAAPAEFLYRSIFRLIETTFLPTQRARQLPLWRRALKRVAWKYITPRLPHIKAGCPRLVMPGGYIDRELSAKDFAHDYHAVNLMDLVRHQRIVPSKTRDRVLHNGISFVRRTGLDKRWKEMDYHRYALGFWAEALYQSYMNEPREELLSWLAEAVLDLEDTQQGLPPSLLGANSECIPSTDQYFPALLNQAGLRAVNLSRREKTDVLLVNSANEPSDSVVSTPDITWSGPQGPLLGVREGYKVPPRGWLRGTRET